VCQRKAARSTALYLFTSAASRKFRVNQIMELLPNHYGESLQNISIAVPLGLYDWNQPTLASLRS
jgi:hypothetical protein